MALEQPTIDTLRHLCPLDCGWTHDQSALPDLTGLAAESIDELVHAARHRQKADTEALIKEHLSTHGPEDWLPALTAARAVPAEARTSVADWLRREAAALDRLCEQLAWPVLPAPPPRLDAVTFRAVADHLESLEPE